MNMLRTIIWVLLTAVLVIFAMANWSPVTVTVWPGEVLDTKLPLLILISFLVGSLPMWIALRTTRWTLNRRLNDSERQLADLRLLMQRQAEEQAAAARDAESTDPTLTTATPSATPTAASDTTPPLTMDKL